MYAVALTRRNETKTRRRNFPKQPASPIFAGLALDKQRCQYWRQEKTETEITSHESLFSVASNNSSGSGGSNGSIFGLSENGLKSG